MPVVLIDRRIGTSGACLPGRQSRLRSPRAAPNSRRPAACRDAGRGHTADSVAVTPLELATESVIVNMYLSSTAMTRLKTRPAPLSQVSVTGWSGVSVLTSAVQTVSRLGVLTPLPLDEPRLGKIGVGRAARRKEPDQRALLVDGLAIVLEHEIVELAALEVDRAAQARRVDDDPRARSQGLADRFFPGGGAPRERRAAKRPPAPSVPSAALGWASAFGTGLLACSCAWCSRWYEGTGVEILPRGHHQDGQRDGEKEVPRVLGVHVRLSLPFGVLWSGPRWRFSVSPRAAARNGAAHIVHERCESAASASRRAIST